MTQEEQLKAFEQALEDAWKHYRESGAAIVDALEENTQELAFAKGFNAGYKQSVEHPTGGELLHVLNKGCKQGYKDAVEKAYRWLLEQMFELDEGGEIYVADGDASSIKEFMDNFKKAMEEQK